MKLQRGEAIWSFDSLGEYKYGVSFRGPVSIKARRTNEEILHYSIQSSSNLHVLAHGNLHKGNIIVLKYIERNIEWGQGSSELL